MCLEKEKLYVELKNILARQPGPEVAEQLSVYQHNLKEKTRQMKAMASELNMHQAQVNEHRFEIERLTRELQVSSFVVEKIFRYFGKKFLCDWGKNQSKSCFLFFLFSSQDVKRKYYENKRKDQLKREQYRSETKMQGMTPDQMAAMQVAQAQASTNRFTGGGFNLQSGN